jgi:hypothetical protein
MVCAEREIAAVLRAVFLSAMLYLAVQWIVASSRHCLPFVSDLDELLPSWFWRLESHNIPPCARPMGWQLYGQQAMAA